MIPKRFTLVNRAWVVRLVTQKQLARHIRHHFPDDDGDTGDLLGLCNPQAARIFINKDKHISRESMEHTYWHEYVHAMKYADGEVLHDDAEVDRLGAILHQYAKTKTGEQ